MFIPVEFVRPSAWRNKEQNLLLHMNLSRISRNTRVQEVWTLLDVGHSTAIDCKLNIFQMASCSKVRILNAIDFIKKRKLAMATTTFIIFWDFLIFYQIFLSPQVKRCGFFTYKLVICELIHRLSNDLKLRISGD